MTESAQRGLFSTKCSKIQNLINIFEKYTTVFWRGVSTFFFIGGHKIVFWGKIQSLLVMPDGGVIGGGRRISLCIILLTEIGIVTIFHMAITVSH